MIVYHEVTQFIPALCFSIIASSWTLFVRYNKVKVPKKEESLLLANDTKPFSVAIIGGGLGGLAAAVMLQKSGIHAVVFEKDRVLDDRREGYGLTLINNPKGPLAKLDILQQCIERDCPSCQHWVFMPSGKVIGYFGRIFKTNKISRGRGNLRIPRQELRKMLLNKLEKDTIVWDSSFSHCQCNPDNVEVFFTNGKKFIADLVVGADGIRSQIRPTRDKLVITTNKSNTNGVLHHNDLKYIGITVILGLSTVQHPLLTKGGFHAIDNINTRLFTMPYQEDSETGKPLYTMWQLSFSGLDETDAIALRRSNPSDQLKYALDKVKTWFPAAIELIQQTALRDVWSTPLYDRYPMSLRQLKDGRGDPSYGRITVIGDACHPMSMFKGQGANQALEDGPLLAKWLTSMFANKKNNNEKYEYKWNKLSTVISNFEREMVARTSQKVSDSFEASQRYHEPIDLSTSNDYVIDGLSSELSQRVIKVLEERGIGAYDNEQLENKVIDVVNELRTIDHL
jgi:2-polyprenyl-6-methoxyphenol hydroxylase-like FAD-dependent oxidoreductase